MAIKPVDLLYIKNIFWDITAPSVNAVLGGQKVTPQILNKVISRNKVSLLLPVAPPVAGVPKMNVVKLEISASSGSPLRLGDLMDEIYDFYNVREVEQRHVPAVHTLSAPLTYAKLMDGQTLFMGLQYMAPNNAYYVHLLRRTAAGVLHVLQ